MPGTLATLAKRQNPGVTTIGRLEPNDAADIARVHVSAWQVAYKDLLPDEFLDRLRPKDWAAQYHLGDTEQGKPSAIVAIKRGEIAGFSTMGPSRDADDPKAGGGRVALLTQPGEDRLPEALLLMLVGNEQARRFYSAAGWVFDGAQHKRTCGAYART